MLRIFRVDTLNAYISVSIFVQQGPFSGTAKFLSFLSPTSLKYGHSRQLSISIHTKFENKTICNSV